MAEDQTPTVEEIAALAADFALKRKAYLQAHAADYNSEATKAAYDKCDDAEDELMDALRWRANEHPDWLRDLLATSVS